MSQRRLRIFFDGAEIHETPIGWQDITSTIGRVKELNSIFVTLDAALTFTDDGYRYILSKYDEGFCNNIEVEFQELCEGAYDVFFKGIIFISSVELDRKQCTAKITVEDNSFYAKINNNKSLEMFPFAELTKSGDVLTACPYQKVQMFNPNDGSYIGVLVSPDYTGAMYRVYDLFSYMISFMTDNTIEFDSTLFGVGGDYDGLMITCGIVLRQYLEGGTAEGDFKDNFPKISFAKLFQEVNKKINIGMYIDYSNAIPTVRIERASDIKTDGVSFQALNIDELKESIAVDELYSSVRLGATNIQIPPRVYNDAGETGLLFPSAISFLGWKEEQFITLGSCNIDRELNLVSEFIIDHNNIEDKFWHGEKDNDKSIFMIMCEPTGPYSVNYQAQQGNLEGTSGVYPVYYNLALNGESVINNYYDAIPLPIVQYLGNRDDTFRAENTSIYVLDDSSGTFTQELLPFPTTIRDPNLLWDGNYYTVTIGGLYSFHTTMTFGVSGDLFDFELYIDRLDSFLSPISSVLIAKSPYTLQHAIFPVDASGSIVANVGDKIRLRIRYIIAYGFNFVPVNIYANSFFECTNSAKDGGQYHSFDPEKYPIIQHKWEYPLTKDDFKNIAQSQTDQLEFSRKDEKHYNGWISSIKFKRFKEEKAQFVTYTSKNKIK